MVLVVRPPALPHVEDESNRHEDGEETGDVNIGIKPKENDVASILQIRSKEDALFAAAVAERERERERGKC